MWRLILGLVLGYLGYLVLKKLGRTLGLGGQSPEPGPRPGGGQEPDVLVQDPVCQTFIPRREALKVHRDGKDHFFCSEGCLKRFLRAGNH
jgi:uncharacterized protein